MYYLIGTDKAERDLQKAKMHVYDISEGRMDVFESLRSILEFDRKKGNTNTAYSIFETDGKEIELYRRKHISSRIRTLLQTFDTLIDTVIDTLNNAIDLTEKFDGGGHKCR